MEETLVHPFFTCAFSVCCWMELNISRNYLMLVPLMILDSRQQFGRAFFREVVIVACWCIWMHRNSIIFYGDSIDGEVVSRMRWQMLILGQNYP
ncbi:hypothetical protein HU200_038516 [Digitaria exilis]|uniref:Uncharacterized protein n=1 Tax=Digitaria exilis TaxID=1010633 RepID=A0A835ELT3_9POAL|nr:hypothetical protein HU200_038516 [Digitaria exilis]